MSMVHVAVISVELAALVLVPVILLQRKEPVSTFAWILTLLFLPGLGALLFLLFGRVTIREVRSARASANAKAPVPLATPGPLDAPDVATDCFRIARVLTHSASTLGNGLVVLEDGDAAYRALGAAIDAAQWEINAEYYLIKDDDIGRWFRDRLISAANRGVKVRLLYDGIGSLAIGRRWTRSLRSAGAETMSFSPLRRALVTSPNLRNHRKIVVIDREIAFTGGINICNEHSQAHSGDTAWRDIHLRIQGPAVNALFNIFSTDWAWVTQKFLKPQADRTQGDGSGSRVAVVPAGPDSHGAVIHRLFFTAIAGARSSVRIVSPYFGPDETLLVALEMVAQRGVAVEMILPARSNHRVTFHAGRSLYERLLEAGVVICEYQPRMIHAKLLVIDDALALIGSSNMDLRSFRLNFEVTVLIECKETLSRLRSIFDEYQAHSQRIVLEQWRRRGLKLTLKEGAARLLSPLL